MLPARWAAPGTASVSAAPTTKRVTRIVMVLPLVARVLGQRRIDVSLGLRDREAFPECEELARRAGVGIVVQQAVVPVVRARLFRVAAYQIEPALRLEGELPRALHKDGVAHRQLVHRLARGAVVVRLGAGLGRSEEHTSELQSPDHLVCRLLLEKKKKKYTNKWSRRSAVGCV